MIKRRVTENERVVSKALKEAGQEHQRFVRPGSEGLLVRDPLTKSVLPPAGALKPWVGPEGRYWRRRLACGDVALVEAPTSKELVELKDKVLEGYKEVD